MLTGARVGEGATAVTARLPTSRHSKAKEPMGRPAVVVLSSRSAGQGYSWIRLTNSPPSST